jgi:hypothetical protein
MECREFVAGVNKHPCCREWTLSPGEELAETTALVFSGVCPALSWHPLPALTGIKEALLRAIRVAPRTIRPYFLGDEWLFLCKKVNLLLMEAIK